MKLIFGGFAVAIVGLIIWRHVLPDGILLYEGIGIAVLSAIGVYLLGRKSGTASWKDASLVFLLTYAFVFTVPTTVDRSYSVRMIEMLASSPNGATEEEIAKMFREYFDKGGAVDRRLHEQMATGSVKHEGNRYVVSNVGRFLAISFSITRRIFHCGSPT